MAENLDASNSLVASDTEKIPSAFPAKHQPANIMYSWLPRAGRQVSMSMGYVESVFFACLFLLISLNKFTFAHFEWFPFLCFYIYGVAKFLPATLTLNQDGFGVRWLYGNLSTGTIAWNNVISVSCRELSRAGKPYQPVAIDLVLSRSACSPAVWLWAHLILDGRLDLRELFSTEPIRLTISNRRFAKEADTAKALIALKGCLSGEQLDCSVAAFLERQNECDFTTLWFNQLQTSNESLIPCSKGALIGSERYEIIERIGSGGQALAYLAVDRSSGDRVALKEFVLPVAGGAEITKAAMKHIEDEFLLLRTLEHPRIVKGLDQFCEGRRAYLVMNYIKGQSLHKYVESNGAMSEQIVIETALQICDILEYLHARTPAVVHRDLTPDNLLLNADGQVYLIDFNVAKELDSLSASNTVVGKHNYIPPEQFRGQAVTQSDIYAMGATLFWLLTGLEPEPITAAHPKAILAEVSIGLDQAVADMTQPDVSRRVQCIADVRAALNAVAAQVPNAAQQPT